MTPIKIQGFVSQANGSAAGIGSSNNHLQIAGVRGPNPAAKGPNDALFGNLAQANVMLQLTGLTDEIQGLFKPGQAIDITISDPTQGS